MELLITVAILAVAQVLCVGIIMSYHYKLMNTIAILKAAPTTHELREMVQVMSPGKIEKAVAAAKEEEEYMPHEFPDSVRTNLSTSLNSNG